MMPRKTKFFPGKRRNTNPYALRVPRTNFAADRIVVMTIEFRRNIQNGTDVVASE